MITFHLNHKSEGVIELVRAEPIVIATFTKEANARNMLDLLVGQAMGAMNEQVPEQVVPAIIAEEPAKAVAEVADKPVAEPPVEAKKETRKPAAPETLPARLPASSIAPLRIGELDAAFARIRDGEKIAMVAQDIGMPMTVLRAKWANHQRYLKATVNPDIPALPL